MEATQNRNLDDEFNNLMPLYQGSEQEHMEGFANLFIDTLKAEPQMNQWSELSEKFPIPVRLWAMTKMYKAFKNRLKLQAPVVNRWRADLDLQHNDAKLLAITAEGPEKEAQREIISRCLAKCSDLMFTMLTDKDTTPKSISDLRQILDTSHAPSLQLRVLERERKRFMDIFQRMFTKDTFHIFKEGVKLGKLYDDNVREATSDSKSALEQHLKTMATHLQQRLLGFDSPKLSQSILEQYHPLVQYRVLGQEQCVLMAMMKESVAKHQRSNEPCLREIRSIVAGLKEELDLDSEAMVKSRLFSGLRLLTVNLRRRSMGAQGVETSVIFKELNALPTKIVLTAIENADEDLDVKLIELFDRHPPHIFIPVMVRDFRSILDASPEQLHVSILIARDYVIKELVPLAKERKKLWISRRRAELKKLAAK